MEETKKVVEEMDGVRALSDEELDNVNGGCGTVALIIGLLGFGAKTLIWLNECGLLYPDMMKTVPRPKDDFTGPPQKSGIATATDVAG